MSTGQTHEIRTFEDMVRLYAGLPEARGELMLKEVGDAVRMLAPMATIVSLGAPLRWIDSDGGKATINFTDKAGGEPLVTVTAALPKVPAKDGVASNAEAGRV